MPGGLIVGTSTGVVKTVLRIRGRPGAGVYVVARSGESVLRPALSEAAHPRHLEVPAEHKLLAPTLLRSQTLSALHEAVQRGEITADDARDQLAWIGRLSIRLLGDGVLRRRAWDLAHQLGWASTYDAGEAAKTASPSSFTRPKSRSRPSMTASRRAPSRRPGYPH